MGVRGKRGAEEVFAAGHARLRPCRLWRSRKCSLRVRCDGRRWFGEKIPGSPSNGAGVGDLTAVFIDRERSLPVRFAKIVFGSGFWTHPAGRSQDFSICSRRMTWRTGFMVPLQQGHSSGSPPHTWRIRSRQREPMSRADCFGGAGISN